MTRSRRLGAVLLGVLLALVASLGVAVWLTESPADRQARLGPPPPSVISVAVEERRLHRAVDLTCEAGQVSGAAITVGVDPSVGDAVVTARPTADGTPVDEGDVLLEVSGRPVIALAGPIPAYRDIRVGDSGPDVAQLETALDRLGVLGYADDTADRWTRSAVESLYRSLGRDAPDNQRLVASRFELVPVASLPGVLRLGPLGVGSRLDEESSISVGGTDTVVRCPVDRSVLPQVRAADRITVDLPGRRDVPAGLQAVTRSSAQRDGETSGAVVVLRPHRRIDLEPGTLLTARAVVDHAPRAGTVVPLTAVWRDANGRDVVSVVEDAGTRLVPVTLGFDDGLSVMVEPLKGSLDPGDEVEVGTAADAAG